MGGRAGRWGGEQLEAFLRATLAPPDGVRALEATAWTQVPERGPAYRLWMLLRQLPRAERALVPVRGTPAYDHWRATLVDMNSTPPALQPLRRAGRDRRTRLLASV